MYFEKTLLTSITDIFYTQTQFEAKKFYDKSCLATKLCVKFYTVCKAAFRVPIRKLLSEKWEWTGLLNIRRYD